MKRKEVVIPKMFLISDASREVKNELWYLAGAVTT
jgi:hypothetical protein